MAFKNIKGLTIEIGADTTNLGKALEDVNKKSGNLSKELGEINKLLRLDPGNADLLAQKQKVLADAVENTRSKLDTLKEAERQVQEQFQRGEVSEQQVRDLQREVIACASKLEGYEKAAKETADAVENLGKKSQEALEQTAQVNDSLAGGLAKGLAGVGTAAAAAVTALAATAESTREYRTAMGKLDTAFADNGFSADAARDAYTELQSVLGDTDQAVEAANHLAKLTDNEKDLATWTGDILPGIFATFGASLPIEGLTEAANETAKVGQVTGPLADALNWAGVSEDAFNESLAKCSTEQERQQMIMSSLVALYGDAGATYKETNADVIAANEANEKWAAGMAEIGAFVEPIITEVKTFGAELLTKVVPAIQTILDNLPAIGVALAGVTAAMAAFKIAAIAATAAQEGMTLVQYAAAAAQKVLNAAMSANPIGIIILAITALVTAFMLLWNNSEEFRNFWINLWEDIKAGAKKAIDAVVGFFKSLPERAKAMVDFFKELPTRTATYLAGVISKVATWAIDLANKGKAAAKSLVDSVVNGIKALPNKVLTIGKDLVTGLWNGITNKLSWLKSKLKSFTNSVLDSIKGFFGVHSPSKETAWVGEMLDEGLAQGVEDAAQSPVRAMQRVSGSVLDAAASEVGGIGFERSLRTTAPTSVAASASVSNNAALLAKLDGIYERLGRLQMVTDTGVLVGEMLDKIDAALGNKQMLAARGVS